MKVGIIGAGTMGSGIAQAFAQVDGYEVCLCDKHWFLCHSAGLPQINGKMIIIFRYFFQYCRFSH